MADLSGVQVEHGSDGCRVLTLMEMARPSACRRRAGERTVHMETMDVLDLAPDKRAAAVPVKPVPWGRFEGILRSLNLE